MRPRLGRALAAVTTTYWEDSRMERRRGSRKNKQQQKGAKTFLAGAILFCFRPVRAACCDARQFTSANETLHTTRRVCTLHACPALAMAVTHARVANENKAAARGHEPAGV